MRLLFASTSGQGHIQPLLPLIEASSSLGHEAMLIAPKGARSTLESSGCRFRVGGEPASDESDRVWSKFSSLERADASTLVEREWFARLCARAMMPAMCEAFDEWSPDLIFRETCEYSSAVQADRRGIAQAQIGISTAASEAGVLTNLVAPDLDEFNLHLAQRLLNAPYVTRFPASMDPSPYPLTFRYQTPSSTPSEPLPDWWSGGTDPLVYVTFGTSMTNSNEHIELLRSVISDLQELPLRLLVTTSQRVLPSDLGPVSSRVHIEQWVAQAKVLSQASLVVCHGGSGTTFGALGAGVPLVLLPMFADQPTNARLVHATGAGIALNDGWQSGEANAASAARLLVNLRDAVLGVLREPRYRESALRVAGEMRSYDAPEELIERLTRR